MYGSLLRARSSFISLLGLTAGAAEAKWGAGCAPEAGGTEQSRASGAQGSRNRTVVNPLGGPECVQVKSERLSAPGPGGQAPTQTLNKA